MNLSLCVRVCLHARAQNFELIHRSDSTFFVVGFYESETTVVTTAEQVYTWWEKSVAKISSRIGDKERISIPD